MSVLPGWMILGEEVREALASGGAVVALESSVWAQGLPRPMNLEVASECCHAIREAGAIPAIVTLGEGRVRVGLDDPGLEELCGRQGMDKVGVGDLPAALASGRAGATSVSGTLVAAEAAGIEVFSTGGLGGVHWGWQQSLDISADLGQLARTRCLTVCSGVKSVLDVPASLEVMETLGLPLALYRTDLFPQFYGTGRALGAGFRVDSPEEVARAHRLSQACLGRGLVVAQPAPEPHQIPGADLDRWLGEGMVRAEREGHTGKALTPFLLDFMARASGGATLESNRALLIENAALAARVAVCLASLEGAGSGEEVAG